jgi:hypothetical protein
MITTLPQAVRAEFLPLALEQNSRNALAKKLIAAHTLNVGALRK